MVIQLFGLLTPQTIYAPINYSWKGRVKKHHVFSAIFRTKGEKNNLIQ